MADCGQLTKASRFANAGEGTPLTGGWGGTVILVLKGSGATEREWQ